VPALSRGACKPAARRFFGGIPNTTPTRRRQRMPPFVNEIGVKTNPFLYTFSSCCCERVRLTAEPRGGILQASQ